MLLLEGLLKTFIKSEKDFRGEKYIPSAHLISANMYCGTPMKVWGDWWGITSKSCKGALRGSDTSAVDMSVL